MKRETATIAQGILRYLLQHPDAEDTLEGIAHWWLGERTIKRQTLAIKKALASLVEEGLIIEVEARQSRTLYKLNKPRQVKTKA
jgi:hypothetical protein